MEINPNRLYTVAETAKEVFGISEGAMRLQIHKGRAPKSGKVMGRRVFRGSDLIAFIEAAFEGAE